ncbi:ribosomal RNA processing protein 1 homolog B-like isoform X1 [Epinephelus moara]|uniref:ribosomal RNA processing protein 1 homolog B-like isoform X1 n=1 Tax=Epinephelus moara TaxID=300413 RepID=UPI00214DF27C|nr:ribosomal RNA processing protein 1 homolog B-like isoform X1 [Epinephelus moara]
MASTPEPEVQLAQRLASNEKPIRTKAIKKLRKYINARSHNASGGFTGDELLKLWKGLFYCLWMQDKPLLQEELSNQLSTLIHSFHSIDEQFLYLESFLQTFKREWTGIDRLRMDKFLQLVRFMFRQIFEMLKRKNWESGMVARFLDLLTVQLLQSSSEAPSGLQFHILDLYMTELAAVGSAELTADQNLIFIEPFCKTAAKTKDRSLSGAICSSIFSTIIDQAPFAIDDLMKELKAAKASDSGQASEEDDKEDQPKEKMSKPVGKKGTSKQINGKKLNEEKDDSELLNLEDLDTEVSCDDDIGPVLQFDYAALVDKLFELASRSSTPSHNRKRLYKIIKVLRDLNKGIFPQDEYPEEVSTDEDDEMFGSRKRMKRGGGQMEEEDEGAPAAKKSKGKKKKASTLNKLNKDSGKDHNEPTDPAANIENKKNKKKKKKRKKKKNAGEGGSAGKEENTERSEHEQTVDQAQSAIKDTEGGPECSQTEDSGKEAQMQSSLSSLKVIEAATTEGQSGTLLLSEVNEQPTVTVTEETSQPTSCTTDNKGPSKKLLSEADATVSGKKTQKKKGLKAVCNRKRNKMDLKADESPQVKPETQFEVEGKHTDAEITSVGQEESQDATTVPLKKKTKKKGKQEDATLGALPAADETTVTPLKKNREKNQKESTTAEEKGVETKLAVDAEKVLFDITMTTPAKKQKKSAPAKVHDKDQTQSQVVGSVDEEPPLDDNERLSSSGKLDKRKKRKIPVIFEYEVDELQVAAWQATSLNGLTEEEEPVGKMSKPSRDVGESSTPLHTKKSQKKISSELVSNFITFQSNASVPAPLFCKTKGSPSLPLLSKKKSRTPTAESKKVTFGLKNNKTAEFRKTDRSLLVSPDGSSRVPFDPEQKPKFGVLKSPPTQLSIRKTPKVNKKSISIIPKRKLQQRLSETDFS